MGIYDRDYARDTQPGATLGGNRMMVTNLVLINVAVYLVDLVLMHQQLSQHLALTTDLTRHPWQFYELLTYGFLHNPKSILHILFNMYALWFFGRDIEWKYGRREFLAFYLTGIVLAGAVWLFAHVASQSPPAAMIGASGGVVAVLLLYCINYPKRTLLVWGILPLPAWVIAAFCVMGDISGAINPRDAVAYTAHLAGAAYGFLYFRTGWSFGRLLPRGFSLKSLKRRPQLRVHKPDDRQDKTAREVDEILRKIQTQGQDSLTKKERRTLEEASRRYQQKHR